MVKSLFKSLLGIRQCTLILFEKERIISRVWEICSHKCVMGINLTLSDYFGLFRLNRVQ